MQDKITKNNSCFLCGATDKIVICDNCHQMYGCKKHLKKHRSNKTCYPLKVQYSKDKGHYLVATRAIKFGEVVLQEEPAIQGKSSALLRQISKIYTFLCIVLTQCSGGILILSYIYVNDPRAQY